MPHLYGATIFFLFWASWNVGSLNASTVQWSTVINNRNLGDYIRAIDRSQGLLSNGSEDSRANADEEYGQLTPRERYLRARESPTWKQTPALALACLFGDADTVKSLIAEGADVNAAPATGETGLMLASRF